MTKNLFKSANMHISVALYLIPVPIKHYNTFMKGYNIHQIHLIMTDTSLYNYF